MSSEDWLVVVALFVVVAAAAYVLGRRRAPPAEASTASTPPPKAKAPENTTAEKAKKELTEDITRLEYEEDAEIDPTKVGVGAQKQKRPVFQPPIQRIVYDEDAATNEPTEAKSVFLVHALAQTDTGLRRKRNEDSLLVYEAANVFVVADGMGGYAGGELASSTAVKTIEAAFQKETFDGPPHESIPRQATELARALQMANAAILDEAQKKPELEGMGTTICAARFSPNKKRIWIAHVGDSRCYRLRSDTLVQMTADHTMADHGATGAEGAMLSRAVGIWPTVPIDIVMGVPVEGDVYLLCSDGLTKMLSDVMISAILRHEDDPKLAIERLIFFANARGGKDNITVILVRVVPPDWKPTQSMTEKQIADVASTK